MNDVIAVVVHVNAVVVGTDMDDVGRLVLPATQKQAAPKGPRTLPDFQGPP